MSSVSSELDYRARSDNEPESEDGDDVFSKTEIERKEILVAHTDEIERIRHRCRQAARATAR
ncbi:hypothetical protein DFH07DRAFT_1058316 [Mycena maculata]|uniref:Uncharacterized protein n=1 Tax=Mycena maculata TaxID=230809 RepID=A0AAD7NNM0_9AGAR|nr:hypothetical protein DFH07DRAFT_1058316 [Mycena maculata]